MYLRANVFRENGLRANVFRANLFRANVIEPYSNVTCNLYLCYFINYYLYRLLLHRPNIGLIRLRIFDGENMVADSGNVYDNTLRGIYSL
jgi:Thrombospondin C-terminal region